MIGRSALVTGAAGQDGHYLVSLLQRRGYVVHAQVRSRAPAGSGASSDGIIWHVGDVTDPVFLEALVVQSKPDEIYNLAAISRPTVSWTEPRLTAEINALVPQQLCELMLKHRPSARLFQASSSEIFGDGFAREQDETTHCVPQSPYGVAKLYAHRIVGAYRQQYGLHVCCGILFNHESPLRPLSFVSQKIAHAAACLARGITDTLELDERGKPLLQGGRLLLGDLGVRRDFGFAGDFVEAMHMILQHSKPDEYVVGTGEDHSIQEFCEAAFRCVGLDWTEHVLTDPKLLRRTDSHYTRSNPAKLFAEIGWKPKVGFENLVEMMVNARLQSLDGVGCTTDDGLRRASASD
jgi:GDPmannose 4,6-dehydratase